MSDNPVYLYHLPIDLQASLDENILSSAEKNRAQRFIKFEDQQRFRFCYIHLRQLLGEHLSISPAEIAFKRNKFGKPYISKEQNPKNIHFNLSHSKKHFLLGIATHNIGVDIEESNRKNDIEAIAKYSFSELELKQFNALSNDKKVTAFYKAWTCKEAFIKALGMGMHFPLKNFSVDLNPDNPAQLLQVNDAEISLQHYSLSHKYINENTQAALVEKNNFSSTIIWR